MTRTAEIFCGGQQESFSALLFWESVTPVWQAPSMVLNPREHPQRKLFKRSPIPLHRTNPFVCPVSMGTPNGAWRPESGCTCG